MRRLARPAAVLPALGGWWLLAAVAAAAEEPAAPAPLPEPAPAPAVVAPADSIETRCWTLLEAWDAVLAAEDPAAPTLDPATFAEAMALAAVAEELLAEGDPATAAPLLDEAFRLAGVEPAE